MKKTAPRAEGSIGENKIRRNRWGRSVSSLVINQWKVFSRLVDGIQFIYSKYPLSLVQNTPLSILDLGKKTKAINPGSLFSFLLTFLKIADEFRISYSRLNDAE